jgi:hypothetical protein
VVVGGAHDDAAERLDAVHYVAPAQPCGLSVAQAPDAPQGVQDAAVLRHSRIRDQRLELGAGEHRACAPAPLSVPHLAELKVREDAGLLAAQAGDLRVAEERARHAVDVPNGPRCELGGAHLGDHLRDVSRLHLLQAHRSDHGVDVRPEAALVIIDRAHAHFAPFLKEALAE